MSSSKKVKTDQLEEFARVRRYILDCPHVHSDHPAILAALKGLDGETKRRERDAKLQSKFMQDAVTVEKPMENPHPIRMPGERKADASPPRPAADEIMTDDWQDVASEDNTDKQQQVEEEESCSFLGQRLAKASVAAMADHSVRVSTPLEAVALALHAAMRSEFLGFSCTGIPETKPNTGFAPPVRELPSGQFLPVDWNKEGHCVALRYRKRGTGAVILKVSTADENKEIDGNVIVEIVVYPTTAAEPPSESLSFSLKDHINLDSWNRALKEQSSISPALHYKSLAALLSNFAKTFDLGCIRDEGDTAALAAATKTEFPYVDTTVLNLPTRQQQEQPPLDFPEVRPPTRDDFAFPGTLQDPSRRPGDFAGDLAPGGLVPGPQGLRPGSGMVMGPNHPLFHGGAPPNGGMRPRFDPFGPPGGPTEPEDDQPGQPPLPPNRTGSRKPIQPNPDHMRPPNFFNSNKFM